ncbi:Predicted AAA-ATPase [uncultured Eubacterium sp.]|nr:Predicted AAA-ATPase [uncultured Eubacterium sp.]
MLISSLQVLSQLLYKHFGKKAIILIDEYDVPLDKAFQNGYYREMVSLIRGLFGMALKTNDSLQFAVLTGCMRISKESIFTGLNNFEVLSILNDQYDELDKNIENLWSVLFTTGYLTHNGHTESGKYRLVIPNKEVRNLFVKKIREWFLDVSRNDGKTLEEFCSAFVDKDPENEKIEQIFGDYLWNTISIRDTAVAKEKKENFYHGILLGLLGYKSNWLIKSNAESGIGYSDILVEVPTNRTGIVIEIKYAEDGDLDVACEKALKQIEEKDYVAKLKQDGMKNFIKYGIACFKKICKVKVE